MATRIEIHTLTDLLTAMTLVNLESVVAGYEAFTKRSPNRLQGLFLRCPKIKHIVMRVPDSKVMNVFEILPPKIETLEFVPRKNPSFAVPRRVLQKII